MTSTHQQELKVFPKVPPSDGLTRFVGAGAWAAVVSGMVMAVSLLMEWLVVPHERLGTEAFLTSSYHVSSGLRLLSIVLLVWGLIGIYGRQSRALGTFGLWAFLVAFLGTALTVGNVWAEVFVWPTLTEVDPNALSGTDYGRLPVPGGGPERVFPAVWHRADPVRGRDVLGACLPALGVGVAGGLDTRDDLPRSHAGVFPGVDRPDPAGDSGCGPRLVRLEDTDLKQVGSRTEDPSLHRDAGNDRLQTEAKGEGKL
jgi:hypothetical protein